MMGFLHIWSQSADTLRRRRFRERCRRLLAALLAGTAVFAALQCVLGTVATRPVLVAVADIRRGETIRAESVAVREAPVSDPLARALETTQEATGRVAQADIARGSPLLREHVADQPVAPPGYTVVDVRLAGGWSGLIVGQTVGLSAAGVCGQTDPTGASGAGTTADVCVVAERAIIMGPASQDETGTALMPLALPADEALRLLGIQEQGMIVAVAGAA